MKSGWLMIVVGMAVVLHAGALWAAPPISKTVTEVLREPLPSEDLTCTADDARITIQGPTFGYTVDRATGAIASLEAVRDGTPVVGLETPADLWFDGVRLSDCDGGTTEILSQGPDRVIVRTEGALPAGVPYTLETMFYNDGVVVSEMTLRPADEYRVHDGIRFEVTGQGRFGHYLHKRRDTNGTDSFQGALPEAGTPVELATLTSCLQVFSHEAALAIFTDRGGTHRSPADAATASLLVNEMSGGEVSATLTQHIVRIAPGGEAFVVPGGDTFTFRTGLAVAPNRHPHPRWRDLRMFIWVGDGEHPYPTDEEIHEAARLGFTLFQMHRLGTPGVPRPPAEEFDRVLETVHNAGMLFIWTANADLMYANAEGVQAMKNAGNWHLWQGFNYGGRYTASMDPYCDLIATCLASPNGLDEYRMATIKDMLEKYPVDGMYIDDNLAYSNCTLWKEHGHPEPVYDCLIELHDVNWRRRQVMLAECPHAVLIDHSSHAFVLPVISAFDVHLFGEGYTFASLDSYWTQYGSYQNHWAQGCLWAGDTEAVRCGAELAYAFDLLTGGGQYSYLDWRLWPDKFPYASGVTADEVLFVKTFNRAQHYFGLYESEPHYFATAKDRFAATAPGTYASLYHNQVWNDVLLVVANPKANPAETSVVFSEPLLEPLAGERTFAVYDVHQRSATPARGAAVLEQFANLHLAPNQTRLLYVREVPEYAVYHQWGGKRISENWDAATNTLAVTLHGPATLEDRVFFALGDAGVARVIVDGVPAEFFVDPARRMVHGNVTFGTEPVRVEVVCAADGTTRLPEQTITPDALAAYYAPAVAE